MRDNFELLAQAVPEMVAAGRLLTGEAAGDDYGADECLTIASTQPAAVAIPESTAEVSAHV